MKHKPTIDLLGFGIAAVDDLVELSHFPQSGDKMQVLVIDIDDHDRVKLSRRRAMEAGTDGAAAKSRD